jgi:AraC-like DNA-binding protein
MWIINMQEIMHPFPQDSFLRRPLHIEGVGCSICDESYRHTLKHAEVLAFEYVLQGKGTVEINGLTYHPQAGDVYILQTNSNFHVTTDPDNPWTKLWFFLRGDLVENIISAYHLVNIFHISNCPVQHLFERIFETATDEHADKQVIQNKLLATFYEIVVEISSVVARRKISISDDVLRVKNYLDNHLEGQVTLQELSDLTQKSQAQTIRMFKKEIGATPYAYFLNKKIEQAKILLHNSDITIKDIATRLCFNDEYYFSNLFKQKTGLSPLHYRQAMSNKG